MLLLNVGLVGPETRRFCFGNYWEDKFAPVDTSRDQNPRARSWLFAKLCKQNHKYPPFCKIPSKIDTTNLSHRVRWPTLPTYFLDFSQEFDFENYEFVGESVHRGIRPYRNKFFVPFFLPFLSMYLKIFWSNLILMSPKMVAVIKLLIT